MKTTLDSLKNSLETINNLYAIKGGGGEDDDDFGNPRRPNRIPPRVLVECIGDDKNKNGKKG